MGLRFWLSEKDEPSLNKPQVMDALTEEDLNFMRSHQVKQDSNSGAKYIEVFVDPMNPGSPIPGKIGHGDVSHVSYVDVYYTGFRTDGIYKLGSATARVVMEVRFAETMPVHYQRIEISAQNVQELREIYSHVRSGKLQPTEDWGVSTPELKAHGKRTNDEEK